MRLSPICAAAGLALFLSGTTWAQLTDLQPGRNFPTAVNAFNTNHSENLDVGDVDNDGDYDVIIANGGDSGNQPNRIFVNRGGLQGLTEGTFSEETSTRFAGFPNDTSRDCEFADFENDGDLDIYISNRGGSQTGQVSRAYVNQGGIDGGTIGFYTEGTDGFWGNLVSVPSNREVGAQDGEGPWEDWSCDCDFGDLDDDGDLDLFHSSYGPNINGSEDSRIFMNDGEGRFDERWTWVNAGADIRLHTLDIDLADFDGDFDIDVFGSSRDSQARVYRNNLDGADNWTGTPFTDMTQTALINTGAGLNGSNNYEAEFADLDGDGDFDMWMKNYDGGGGGNLDRILRNNGNFTFTKMTSWIKGDPNTDENEVDFFDYDSDGDLDAFVANFLGTNWIYQGGLAQGLSGGTGLYHRNGTASAGSLATWPEAPTNANSAISLDGEVADMDGDGDPDIMISNDSGNVNRYWVNAGGVPDTHAPTFEAMTVQGNKSDGSDTEIHVALRDNASYYIIGYYRVNLIYTVDGGDETCIEMFSQGSQQFRGVIPGGIDGEISYRVEATDDNGNTGVSQTVTYDQNSSGDVRWQGLGCGTNGVYGVPYLQGSGPLTAGSNARIDLRRAAPGAIATLFMAVNSTPVPFKGGTLYAFPAIVNLGLLVDGGGQIVFDLLVPGGVPSGFPIFWQYAISDASALGGVSLSNAAASTNP